MIVLALFEQPELHDPMLTLQEVHAELLIVLAFCEYPKLHALILILQKHAEQQQYVYACQFPSSCEPAQSSPSLRPWRWAPRIKTFPLIQRFL
jgi:hypothetical protein